MKVDEATEIIDRAIQSAFSQYLFDDNVVFNSIERDLDEAVEAGLIVKWARDKNGDYLIVPNRPVEFINLNFVATKDGIEFEEAAKVLAE
jgi:hypothetical protein